MISHRTLGIPRQALEEVRRAGAERNAQALASWCFKP